MQSNSSIRILTNQSGDGKRDEEKKKRKNTSKSYGITQERGKWNGKTYNNKRNGVHTTRTSQLEL